MNNNNTYNGWTNCETWHVKLHIDNNYVSDRYWRERAEAYAKRAKPGKYLTAEQQAVNDLADLMQWAFEDDMPELGGTYGDLLGAALSSVNWYEIAESLIEEVKE